VDRWRCLLRVEDDNAMVTWASYVDGVPVVVERVRVAVGMESDVKRCELQLDRATWS
jgi:hypothetical protein